MYNINNVVYQFNSTSTEAAKPASEQEKKMGKMARKIVQLLTIYLLSVIFLSRAIAETGVVTPSDQEVLKLKSAKNGDLVICANYLEDSEDGSKTSMIIEMAMIVDKNNLRSQELEGRRLGKKSLWLETKKYADLDEACDWVDVIKDKKEKEEMISNILIRGLPVGAVASYHLHQPTKRASRISFF